MDFLRKENQSDINICFTVSLMLPLFVPLFFRLFFPLVLYFSPLTVLFKTYKTGRNEHKKRKLITEAIKPSVTWT